MLHFLFSVRGRVGRKTMWLFYFAACICWGIAVAAIYGIADFAEISDPLGDVFLGEPVSAGGWCIFALLALAYALLVVCLLAVMSKRLHDRNRSAWWLLPIYGGVALVAVLDNAVPDTWIATEYLWTLWNRGVFVTMALLGIAGLWLFLELFLLPGTRGPNRYGPDPLVN